MEIILLLQCDINHGVDRRWSWIISGGMRNDN